MKAIGVKLVDLKEMIAEEAITKGYKVGDHKGNDSGYEVTYPDGYKSWCPANVADKSYFGLNNPNPNSLTREDIDTFINSSCVVTLGDKTTAVTLKTITGFEVTATSSCVKKETYDKEIGSKIATERAKDTLWECLGFVLQWAINGLKRDIEL